MWRWCGQSTELNESKPTSNFPNIMRAANDDDDGDSDIECYDGDEADTLIPLELPTLGLPIAGTSESGFLKFEK